MTTTRLAWLLLATVTSHLQAQQSLFELSVGMASPSSELSSYARPGGLLELHIGRERMSGDWGSRVRLQFVSYQGQQVTEASVPYLTIYHRRTSSFLTSFEFLTPAMTAGAARMRGLFGFGVEAWRLTEVETRHFTDGVTPDQVTDNGWGVYFGYGATLGLRLDFARRAHAELRVEASKVAFLGVFEDRHFNAPVRLTASAGWRF